MNEPTGTGCYACNGSGVVDDHDGTRACLACNGVPRCRFGYVEHDGFSYCHEHAGFAHFYGPDPRRCDRKPTAPEARP